MLTVSLFDYGVRPHGSIQSQNDNLNTADISIIEPMYYTHVEYYVYLLGMVRTFGSRTFSACEPQ